MVAKLIDAETLRELLEYDGPSGMLFWRQRAPSFFKTKRAHAIWNAKYPGKVAGSVTPEGYIQVNIMGRIYRAHRLVWLYVHGSWPDAEIDHANGIRFDNRLFNLRCATTAENSKNRGLQSNNKSGFQGVSWCSSRGMWRATNRLNGKQTDLGLHETPYGAHLAYKAHTEALGFTTRHIHGVTP